MMHQFLSNNRDDLIARCRLKIAHRPARGATAQQLQNGVPLLLDHLIQTLRLEQTAKPIDSRKISGPAGGQSSFSTVGNSAFLHGPQLLELGFSINQVVHDYGDLCKAINDLAFDRDAPFQIDEFRTLDRCLDNAIADAVTAFSNQSDSVAADKYAAQMNERMGFFAHELRNFFQTATLAFGAAKAGNLSLSGATGAVLERSLNGLGDLIDGSLAEVPLTAGSATPPQIFSLADFIGEIKQAAAPSAQARGCAFLVSDVNARLAVRGNRDLLFSALGNLLHNAFKFTHTDTEVTLDAYAVADRILIDVKDQCGGFSADDVEGMFEPFRQNGVDRTGLRLGLSIVRRSVEASDSMLRVHGILNTGCVFTISLPRHAMIEQ